MGTKIWNNPNNIWGKWLKRPMWQRLLTLLLIFIVSLCFPLINLLEQSQDLRQATSLWQQQQEKLQHQQRLWQQLKQQSEQALLTPELTKQLLPINQSLQRLGDKLHFEHQQWQFQQNPRLSLQVQGNFTDLTDFLTALLTEYQELGLLSLTIQQLEESETAIESQILLQLNRNK